jgi:hypothetical protein
LSFTPYSLLEEKGMDSREKVVEIWYSFAIDKPKLDKELPQDEWVSCIRPLSGMLNSKAKTYAVCYFNGQVKIMAKDN